MAETPKDDTPKIGGKCPECGKPTVEAFRPFCCKRCADVDLGRWFNESYVLPGDSEIDDDIDGDAPAR